MIRAVTKGLDPASDPAQRLVLLGAHELLVTSEDSSASTTAFGAHYQPGDDSTEVRLDNLVAIRASPHTFLWNLMLPRQEVQRELVEACEPSPYLTPDPASSLPQNDTIGIVLHAPGATPQDRTPLRRLAERVDPRVVVVTGALPAFPLSFAPGAADEVVVVRMAVKTLTHQLRFGLPLVAPKPSRGAAFSASEEDVEEEPTAALHDQGQRVGVGFIGLLELYGANARLQAPLLRAAAQASLETGAPIFLAMQDGFSELPHVARTDAAITMLLEQQHVPAGSVVLCRLAGAVDLEGTYVRWLRLGLTLAFSFQGGVFYNQVLEDRHLQTARDWPSDAEAAALVVRLCRQGFAAQLLCSPGVACRIQLRRYGGHGYGHVRRTVVPELLKREATDEDLRLLQHGNILRLLAWWRPPPPVERAVEMGKCDWCGKAFEMRVNEYFSKFSWVYCRGKCLSAHGNAGWKLLEEQPK